MMPIAENKLLIFGPDQGRDWFAARSVLKSGNFFEATTISGGYYSLIPTLSLILASISSVMGCELSLPYLVIPLFSSILVALSFYSILLRLTNDHLTSVIGVFIFLSTPRLAMTSIIPSTLSKAFGPLLLLLLLLTHIYRPRARNQRSTAILLFLLAFVTVTVHPVGIITMLSFAGVFIILRFIISLNRSFQVSPPPISLTRLFVSINILCWTYWIFSNIVLVYLMKPVQKLYLSLSGPSMPSVYTPQYYGGGLQVYAIAFAFPVALSAAYVAASVILAFTDKKRAPLIGEGIEPVVMSASIAGLFLVATAFICVVKSPGAPLERYLNLPAYILLVIPSAVVGALLIKRKQRVVVISTILMLSAFVVIGTSSPDWSPFEYPEWRTVHIRYPSNLEAGTISNFLPQDCYIYSDNDINLGVEAAIREIRIYGPKSYQTVRYILDGIKAGNFQPSEFAHRSVTLYIVKTSDVDPMIIGKAQAHTVYSSGRHLTLAYVTP